MTEIFIITGVTCSGKTSMSMELARKEGAEIISCDSVQIYRGMDIGSAKASAEEMSEIPHHLVDVCDCDKHFDVSEYVALAKEALEDIAARDKKIVVCGGSGFYLRAWFAAVTDGVGIPSEIKSVCDEIERRGASALKEALLKIDPAAADTVDILNPRRAKNALARCMATGMTCAACSARVEKAVSRVPGVTACSVNLLTHSMGVAGSAAPEAVVAAVERAGYGAFPRTAGGKEPVSSSDETSLADHDTPMLKRRLL